MVSAQEVFANTVVTVIVAVEETMELFWNEEVAAIELLTNKDELTLVLLEVEVIGYVVLFEADVIGYVVVFFVVV